MAQRRSNLTLQSLFFCMNSLFTICTFMRCISSISNNYIFGGSDKALSMVINFVFHFNFYFLFSSCTIFSYCKLSVEMVLIEFNKSLNRFNISNLNLFYFAIHNA